jgi:hypothetical protein
MIPTVLLYYYGFSWLVHKKVEMIDRTDASYLRLTDRVPEQEEDGKDAEESAINQTLSWANFKRVLPKVNFYCFNLASVY